MTQFTVDEDPVQISQLLDGTAFSLLEYHLDTEYNDAYPDNLTIQ